MTNTETDLKPCPFCGSDGLIYHSRDGEVAFVRCVKWLEGCMGASVNSYKDIDAITQWNTRATPDHGLDKVREALEGRLKIKCTGYGDAAMKNKADTIEAIAILDGISSPVVGNAVKDGEALDEVLEEIKYCLFACELPEAATSSLMNARSILEKRTPISTEKDENAQTFQCPGGLTCSGDGRDCVGDGLCEKDGNADGVGKPSFIVPLKEQMLIPRIQGSAHGIADILEQVGEFNKEGLIEGLRKIVADCQTIRDAAIFIQTPLAAGWQGIESAPKPTNDDNTESIVVAVENHEDQERYSCLAFWGFPFGDPDVPKTWISVNSFSPIGDEGKILAWQPLPAAPKPDETSK